MVKSPKNKHADNRRRSCAILTAVAILGTFASPPCLFVGLILFGSCDPRRPRRRVVSISGRVLQALLALLAMVGFGPLLIYALSPVHVPRIGIFNGVFSCLTAIVLLVGVPIASSTHAHYVLRELKYKHLAERPLVLLGLYAFFVPLSVIVTLLSSNAPGGLPMPPREILACVTIIWRRSRSTGC